MESKFDNDDWCPAMATRNGAMGPLRRRKGGAVARVQRPEFLPASTPLNCPSKFAICQIIKYLSDKRVAP